MVDPMGKIIGELRASSPLATETGGKIWGEEVPDQFNGQDVSTDARPYVLVQHLVVTRHSHAPVGAFRISVVCVHKTPRLASKLYGLVSDVLHDQGPRRTPGGTAIWRSQEEIGGQPMNDPITGWPVRIGVYEVWAATQVVA